MKMVLLLLSSVLMLGCAKPPTPTPVAAVKAEPPLATQPTTPVDIFASGQTGQAGSQAAGPKNVLVVINESSLDSEAIGSYYLKKRAIPHQNAVFIRVAEVEETSLPEYKAGILQPVKEAIAKLKGSIEYIVLTKGVPIRIQDEGHSVDAELAAMNLTALNPLSDLPKAHLAPNPYFRKAEHFSKAKFNFYLVCRLDGYTVADAKRLVDHSLEAKPEKGPFFFDASNTRTEGGYGEMQKTLLDAAPLLKQKGFEASTDDTPAFVAPEKPLAGYASWGSNDGKFDLATYHKLKFKPGALCETFVSTSGRTFLPTTGGQSLIADLIAQGVTGVKGYVSEPYTFALAHADILFDRYTSGYNLAESFYMASPVLKWKDVVVGDPLCSPYSKK